MDHKRIYDGNKGPNTGGMGVAAPNFYYSDEIADECMKKIFLPTINALNQEGRKFKGCLYFGLMLTRDGAKVIEYNCRFGDPEAEAVLPLLECDLLDILLAVRDERLNELNIKFKDSASCCVILASGGYPGKYLSGYEIDFGDVDKIEGVEIFHCGTKFENGQYYTAGGRGLAVNAVANDFPSARTKAYEAVNCIKFENMRYRSDIGAR